jgi:hypothetical protein
MRARNLEVGSDEVFGHIREHYVVLTNTIDECVPCIFSMTQTGRTFHDKVHVRNSWGDISPRRSWSNAANQNKHLPEHAVAGNEKTNQGHGTTHCSCCQWALVHGTINGGGGGGPELELSDQSMGAVAPWTPQVDCLLWPKETLPVDRGEYALLLLVP